MLKMIFEFLPYFIQYPIVVFLISDFQNKCFQKSSSVGMLLSRAYLRPQQPLFNLHFAPPYLQRSETFMKSCLSGAMSRWNKNKRVVRMNLGVVLRK